MLAKLLALLLQSKGAAISTVFVLGTTGALVSATTQNGVTTVTVTPATESASPSQKASKETDNDKDEHSSNAVTSTTRTTTETNTPKPESCSTEAHAANAAVSQVNSTAVQLKLALDKLAREKGDKGRQAARTTEMQLMQIRQDAVKAIHALGTAACTKAEDKDESLDEDKNDENENDSDNNDENKNENDGDNNDENDDKASPATTTTTTTTTTTGLTFTGTTPQAIADEATAAMTLAFNTAKGTISALPTVTSKDAQTRGTDQKSTKKGASDSRGGHD